MIHSENWDGVTAPALPSGWNVTPAGGYTTVVTTTSGPTPLSSPNVIGTAAGNPARTATWATQDGNSGNVLVEGTGYFAGSAANCEFGVFARGNNATVNYGTSSFYEFRLSGSDGDFEINKYTEGFRSNLFNVSTTPAGNVWYKISASLYGGSTTMLRCVVTRLSDGYTLNMATGLFAAGGGSVSFVDSASPIVGQGYAGWYGYAGPSTPVYGDDWSLSTYSLTVLGGVESHDVLSCSGGFGAHAAVARTERSDAFAALGVAAARGALASAESGDTFAAAGHCPSGGVLAVVEWHDRFASWASVSPFLRGTERRDLFAGSGAAGTGPAGAIAATDGGDTFSGTGGFTYDTRVQLVGAERGDGFSALGTQSSSAGLVAHERGDVFHGYCGFHGVGHLGVTDGGDVFRGGLERVEYHVYSNTGIGDPINYDTPIATTALLTYTTAPLSYPGVWSFGVRAFYVINGLEEKDLNCAVTITLDSSGNDISNEPLPPSGLSLVVLSGGSMRVNWYYPPTTGPRTPTGFHVYIGTGGVPDYASAVADVMFGGTSFLGLTALLTGLTGDVTYTVGVRAYNGVGEESNTLIASAVAETEPPAPVVCLTGTATNDTPS